MILKFSRSRVLRIKGKMSMQPAQSLNQIVEEMNHLIPVINKLQDIFNATGTDVLDLPQIVAVGTQSSGKSSVIENIIGCDFLPRGTGMVTRRPLVLQLIRNDSNPIDGDFPPEQKGRKVAKFLHCENKIFTDFTDVHDEIISETERVLPNPKGVCPQPINLKVYSGDFVNLTLVDLPGLTRIPVGSQPLGTEEEIESMTLDYIRSQNSIILAIVPANIDIATSEALRLAASVDPKRERTLVCLTKLDLMDKGTSAHEMLSGSLIKFKLGIIGVVNRSQFDLEQKKPVARALDFERQFFHQYYPLLAETSGTQYLVRVLNQVLLTHIQKWLPTLREKVRLLSNEFSGWTANLGEPVNDKKFTLINCLNKFVAVYREIIAGTHWSIPTDQLCGGSRISYTFHESFAQELKSMNPLMGLDSCDIATAIKNTKGLKTRVFLPEAAFELLARKQIAKLQAPSLQCVAAVVDEMANIVDQTANQIPELTRFPVLREKLIGVVKMVLAEENIPTCTMIKNLVAAELAYINTNHPDFLRLLGTASKQMRNIGSSSASDVEPGRKTSEVGRGLDSNHSENGDLHSCDAENLLDTHSKFLVALLNTYLKIVNHKFQDSVPKVVICFLVTKVIDRLPNELVNVLVHDLSLDELFLEAPEVTAQRTAHIAMVEALTKANDLIRELKEFKL